MTLSNGALTPKQRHFDGLVVFGDRLSDMGNAGRFSNGPVWVEQLAESLMLPLRASERGGFNFAIGGARIDLGPESLREQVNRFSKRPQPSGCTLYIVWGGANDIFAALGQTDAVAELDAAAMSLKAILADLITHGAIDLLVPNVPDVGITPEVRAQGRETIEEGGKLTDHFNRAVNQGIADLATSSSSIRFYRFDVASTAERARIDPEFRLH
jgi:cholinesterase